MKKGLVLEGGGVKGSYQIGSFYAFKDCGIKLDGFVGTSIGSFNACMLACGKHKELLDFWYNVNPGELFKFDNEFIDIFNKYKFNKDSLKGTFRTFSGVLKNMGIENLYLREAASKLIDYELFKGSGKDFGLVTVKLPKFTPLYVYKQDIKDKDNLLDYLLASCYFPGFKERKLIDNSYYIDGGFYDNSPVKLLSDIGYDEVYVINIKGIGMRKNLPFGVKVINIKPSRNNGGIFELNTSIIRDNIQMGYYDTIRVLKHLDGEKYCFKRINKRIYKWMCRKVDKRLYKRVCNFFNVKTYKGAVLCALEYVLEKDQVDYYDIYNPLKMLKRYMKNTNKHFVYRFIDELKFFF